MLATVPVVSPGLVTLDAHVEGGGNPKIPQSHWGAKTVPISLLEHKGESRPVPRVGRVYRGRSAGVLAAGWDPWEGSQEQTGNELPC